jgi:hypothetical protein
VVPLVKANSIDKIHNMQSVDVSMNQIITCADDQLRQRMSITTATIFRAVLRPQNPAFPLTSTTTTLPAPHLNPRRISLLTER